SPTALYTLSLHDALPICAVWVQVRVYRLVFGDRFLIDPSGRHAPAGFPIGVRIGGEPLLVRAVGVHHVNLVIAVPDAPEGDLARSEEHTSELQSRSDLVC